MKPTSLGELEQQIMDIIWTKKITSIREVHMELLRTRDIAYTTVATILQRLFEKGLVTRHEEKVGYLYAPQISKESYIKNLAQSFMNKLMSSFGDVALASFAESIEDLPKAKRKQLLKLIDKNEKHK